MYHLIYLVWIWSTPLVSINKANSFLKNKVNNFNYGWEININIFIFFHINILWLLILLWKVSKGKRSNSSS